MPSLRGFFSSKWTRIGLGILAVLLAGVFYMAWRMGFGDPSKMTFLNEEGFPLNVDPKHVAAGEAPLEEGDIILGVHLAGEARAYPVNYMNGPQNEVVNDLLGGQAIASTW